MKQQDKYFTVEKILDKKRVGHITKYLIKWDGYSEQDNTWEPLSNLLHIKGIVDEFNQQFKQVSQIETDENQEGSFSQNDKIHKILASQKFEDQTYYLVQWEKRENGFQPQNSLLNYFQLKYECSDKLLDYFEYQLMKIN